MEKRERGWRKWGLAREQRGKTALMIHSSQTASGDRRWREDEVMDGSDLKAQVLLQSAAAAAVLSLPRIGICEEGNAT